MNHHFGFDVRRATLYIMYRFLLLACVSFLIIGCVGQSLSARNQLAVTLADQSLMKKDVVPSHGFDLTLFTKINAPGQPVHVYIEGDGLAWRSRTTPSSDPTPTNPVALRLAQKDVAPNVIYMARPCQYSRGTACDPIYWTRKRYSPDVINALNDALDKMVRAHHLSAVHLIGFSGGGTLAALLATRRADVANIRTVAGNMDIDAHSRHHNVSLLQGSLNPVHEAASLADIPQMHFIGRQDKIVPFTVYQSYAQALPHLQCTSYYVVSNATHEAGWEEVWRALLQDIEKAQPSCAAPSL